MNSDLFALKTLSEELNGVLTGARIDKIQQPETDELRLYLRGQGKNYCLCASCNAGAPRLHLTTNKKQSPATAPTLCMLLRKYLSSSFIDGVYIYNEDRIICIRFTARTEMRDNATYYLFVELMNRYSNIIFTDENLIILDAVKHISYEDSPERAVLRGLKYEPVKQVKTSYLTLTIDFLDNFYGGDLHKYILGNVSGFSALTVSEILFRAKIAQVSPPLSPTEKSRLFDVIKSFTDVRKSGIFNPCIIGNKDVYPISYQILEGEIKTFETMSDAYDSLFTVCDGELRNKARLKSLSVAAKRLIQRTEKNIVIDKERLKECENKDTYRIYGELIVANIYKIKKGDKVLICENYYDGKEIKIALDELLSPSKNSAYYYNKYNKLKRTEEFTLKKLKEDELLLNYALSIENEINSLPYDASAADIEEELEKLGVIKRKNIKGKIRKEKSEGPYSFCYKGFTILAGKNNIQNDELTFKIASSNDIWLHLKNKHGAHVVVLTEGKAVDEDVLRFAGEIAAAPETAPSQIDFTERRNVKRQPGGHPGQVIYVNYKTIVCNPDKHLESVIK